MLARIGLHGLVLEVAPVCTSAPGAAVAACLRPRSPINRGNTHLLLGLPSALCAGAAPFATDGDDGAVPEEQKSATKAGGAFAPDKGARSEAPWAIGGGSSGQAGGSLSSQAYGNFGAADLTVKRYGPMVGDSGGATPYATANSTPLESNDQPAAEPKKAEPAPWALNE